MAVQKLFLHGQQISIRSDHEVSFWIDEGGLTTTFIFNMGRKSLSLSVPSECSMKATKQSHLLVGAMGVSQGYQ